MKDTRITGAVTVMALTKRFGAVAAADGVEFTVAEGEFFTLLGPSGCGKTTTLRCVAGLESADAGRIEIAGQTVFDAARGLDLPANARAIGMVFQSYAVWPHMSVAENIGYPLKVRGVAGAQIAARVAEVLDLLEMSGLGGRMPAQLSGGQQQRVALGRALAVEPRVLLLDEPLSNLDAKLREAMRAELKLIQRRAGLPILYVTHDQVEALSMSDRIAVMNAGRIHHLGPPEEIYDRPRTRFVLDFIGAVNYLPCTVETGAEGRLRLAVPGGGWELPAPAGPVPSAVGLTVAVRPEDLELVSPPPAGLPRGRVTLRAFVGEGFEYRLKVAGHDLRARTEKAIRFAEGAEVGLRARRGVLVAASAGPDSTVIAP
jgi:ABC-type Fe3+/spermidine/putrescine transport system ATPase subunit